MKSIKTMAILSIILLLGTTISSCSYIQQTTTPTLVIEQTPTIKPSLPPTNTPFSTSTPDFAKLKVLFFVSGTLGDRYYFDLFAGGIQRAQKKYGFNLQIIESGWGAINYVSSFTSSLASGTYDIVVAAGQAMALSVETEAAKYPNTKFLLLDGLIKSNTLNVFCGTINMNKAAYLAGLYAGYMTTNTSIHGINSSTKIGAIGLGNDFDNHLTLMSFRNGVIDSGISAVEILIETVNKLEKIEDAEKIASEMYSNGVDIIFQFSGLADYGGAKAAFESNHYIIGMGQDYAETLSYANNQFINTVLTSVVMQPDLIGYDALSRAIEGTLKYGSAESYGIKGNFVGLVKSENFEQLTPPEIKEKISLAQEELLIPKILFVINESWEDDMYSESMISNYKQAAEKSKPRFEILELNNSDSDLNSAWESVFINEAFDILISSGEETVERITYNAPRFPNTKFILIGGKIDFYSNFLPNVFSIAFKTNEALYLAGMYASLMTQNSNLPLINPDMVLGAVAGIGGKPYLDNRIKAYIQGATAAGLAANAFFVDYPEDFFDVKNAEGAANWIFNQKADIILNIAGPAGQGVRQSAQNMGYYIIGFVDTGNRDTHTYTPDQAKLILTSVYENRIAVIKNILNKIEAGELEYGSLELLGLSSGMVGLEKSENYELLTPENIKTEILSVEKKIINREIFVIPEYLPGLYY